MRPGYTYSHLTYNVIETLFTIKGSALFVANNSCAIPLTTQCTLGAMQSPGDESHQISLKERTFAFST